MDFILSAVISYPCSAALDNRRKTHLFSLDIFKAFEQRWYQIWLPKSYSFELHPTLISNMSCLLDEILSQPLHVNAGVLRASILAFTLFRRFINDLLTSASNTSFNHDGEISNEPFFFNWSDGYITGLIRKLFFWVAFCLNAYLSCCK